MVSAQLFNAGILLLLALLMSRKGVNCCTSSFMQLDVLRRRAEKIPHGHDSRNRLDHELRLMPYMNFTCSGNITSLLLGVDIRNHHSYPEVHIWQRNGEQFNRVASREIRLTAGNFSPDGVLRYNLTPPLQFHSGDMLGVYQPREADSSVRLYYSDTGTATPLVYQLGPTKPSLVTTLSLSSLNILYGQHLLLTPVTTNYSCINGFLLESILRQMTLEVSINRVRDTPDEELRLFPDIHLTCNGSLTKWIVGVEIDDNGREHQEFPEVQIWRRQESEDTFQKIAYTLLTQGNTTSYSNVYEYIPVPPLDFQKGDILGVYRPRKRPMQQVVVYHQENTGPANYVVKAKMSSPSSISLGDPDHHYLYPLVTVEISTPNVSYIGATQVDKMITTDISLVITDIRSTSSLEILSNRTIQVPAADATVTEKVIHTSGEMLATANVTDTSNPFMLTTGSDYVAQVSSTPCTTNSTFVLLSFTKQKTYPTSTVISNPLTTATITKIVGALAALLVVTILALFLGGAGILVKRHRTRQRCAVRSKSTIRPTTGLDQNAVSQLVTAPDKNLYEKVKHKDIEMSIMLEENVAYQNLNQQEDACWSSDTYVNTFFTNDFENTSDEHTYEQVNYSSPELKTELTHQNGM